MVAAVIVREIAEAGTNMAGPPADPEVIEATHHSWGTTMARKRKRITMNASEFVAGMRDAASPGTAPESDKPQTPELAPAPEAEEEEQLDDLYQERTQFFRRLDTKCSWCGTPMRLENIPTGQNVRCPKEACHGSVRIPWRLPRFEADVDLLPENVELPPELAAAFQTERPLLAGWLNRPLSAEEAVAIGHAFGVLLEHNSRLGHRVEELEHHLDLLTRDLLTQMGVARGLEAALTRIHRFTRLPVDSDVWAPG
jgi:hypothetical protein